MDGRGHFSVVHALNICHNNHGLEFKRQVVETVLDGVLELVCFSLLVGGHAGVGEPTRGIHFLAIVGIRFEGSRGPSFLPAQFIVAGVRYRAHQPRLERSAAIGCDALESRNERVLGGIGGKIVIAEDTERGIEHAILVVQDERVEGVKVAALCVLNESLFVH